MPDLEDEDEFEKHEYPRHFEDLTPAEKQALGNLTPATIKSCEVVNDWMDDHQLCILVNLNDIEFGAWWCGWEVAGAFLYWDSPKAKEAICQYINESARASAEYAVEDEITPEDLPQ